MLCYVKKKLSNIIFFSLAATFLYNRIGCWRTLRSQKVVYAGGCIGLRLQGRCGATGSPYLPVKHPITGCQFNTVVTAARPNASAIASTFCRLNSSWIAATASHHSFAYGVQRRHVILKMLSSLGNPRQAAAQLMNFGLILSSAFMVGFNHCPEFSWRDSYRPAFYPMANSLR